MSDEWPRAHLREIGVATRRDVAEREREMAPDHNRLQPKAVRYALFAVGHEESHRTPHPSHAPRVILLATESKRIFPVPRGNLSQRPPLSKIPTCP